jgi:murein DD-endopeptidase MepM/ murein hydrolase activator NlpD
VLFLPGAHMPANDVARILGNLFIYPLRGKLTSRFGYRISPITGVRTFHSGVDLKADIGTPVAAAMAGKVVDVGVNATFGRYIILSHGGAYQTLYAHLDRVYVARGTQVSQGEKIAESGNTGETTGPHLHFGIYRGGEAVDPLGYLR